MIERIIGLPISFLIARLIVLVDTFKAIDLDGRGEISSFPVENKKDTFIVTTQVGCF